MVLTLVLQRALKRFFDGSESAEKLGPKLDAVVQGVAELKASLEKLTAMVQTHNGDILLLKATVERMEVQKNEAHSSIWKRLEDVTARIGHLEIDQAGRRKR